MQSSGNLLEISHSDGYTTTAVSIKNLCKSYNSGGKSKELVLNKFCMSVKKGSIYGFLRASGSGKTALFLGIVGLGKWNSGQVLVFGREPGSRESGIPGKMVGYMPQELALYNQLSILETMLFYGRLYGMQDSVIRSEWKVLSGLLDLSNGGSKLIGELSIWKYLCHIAATSGTTIIITTHFIEEARYSDRIGLMRRGRMIVEESPSDLMKRYESNLLERVVMQICRLDQVKAGIPSDTKDKCKLESEQSEKLKFKSSWKLKNKQIANGDDELEGEFRILPSENVENGYYENQSSMNKSEQLYSHIFQSLRKTLGFTWVNFLIFSRYPVFLISILLMPAIQGTITLCAVGSKPIGFPFGIINYEVGDWITSCESTKKHTFIESELISNCQLTSGLPLKTLSCQYLNELKKDKLVDLKVFNSEAEARQQVELGNSWGYMIIPEKFSQSLSDLLLAKQFAMNESIEGSRIPIYLDYSQYISSLFITRNFYSSYSDYMNGLAKSCSTDEKMAEVPLNFREPIYGDNEDNYTAFVMPGLLMFTLFGVVSSLSELLLIEGRRQGTLNRATVAGLTCSNVILSLVIVQGVLTIAQLAVWNIVLYFIFSIPCNGQVWLYILVCLLTGLSGTALGIFVGLILTTELQALYFGSFLMNILMFFGGVLWPLEAMTKFWRSVGSILPTSLPAQSLRSVIVRGVGIGDSMVWPGILVSVFWTIGMVILSVIVYRKKA